MQAPGVTRYALAVGNRIRELRLKRNAEVPPHFTAAKLAARIGVTESALLRWERGDTRPTKRNIARLAHELGVKVEELGLDGEADESP